MNLNFRSSQALGTAERIKKARAQAAASFEASFLNFKISFNFYIPFSQQKKIHQYVVQFTKDKKKKTNRFNNNLLI